MADRKLAILGGPDKPALQWAIAYPDREQVHFKLQSDGVDVQIARMDELADGFTFELVGIVRSGTDQGRPFRARYSVEDRAGAMVIG
ncbi:MAG: hypothetical protein NW223_17750 [Hyphomicrobiaceae bacterium]|nr:hypothetical protein [Hyphomicrobiaceae bacterium]